MSREIKIKFWLVNVERFMDMRHFFFCCEEGSYDLNKVMTGKDKRVKPVQFTGMKNIEGVEIFEGDIFCDTESEFEIGPYAQVVYDETQAKFILIDWRGENTGDLDEWIECPIVGNIFQDPTLLT